METLNKRRESQVKLFAQKAVKHPKHKSWFVFNDNIINTRSHKPIYKPIQSNKQQLQNSPIAYMVKLLNSEKNPIL